MATPKLRLLTRLAQCLSVAIALLCFAKSNARAASPPPKVAAATNPVRLLLSSKALPQGYRFGRGCEEPADDWFAALASETRPSVFRGRNLMIWSDQAGRCVVAQVLVWTSSQPDGEVERLRAMGWSTKGVAKNPRADHDGDGIVDSDEPGPQAMPSRPRTDIKKVDPDWYYIDE